MPVSIEEQGVGNVEFGGFPFSNQDVFSIDVTVGDVGEELPWSFNDPDGVLSAIVPTDGVVRYSSSGRHSYETTGSHTFRVVCIPGARSISDISIGSLGFSGTATFDVSDLLGYFSDAEVVFLRANVTGTATASDLDGVRVWDSKGGEATLPVENFSIAWSEFNQNFRCESGLTGDWSNISSGAYPNLRSLVAKKDKSSVYGSLADMTASCPGLVVIKSQVTILWDHSKDNNISDLHNCRDLEKFVYHQGGKIGGTFSDWSDTDQNGNLYLPKLRVINHRYTMGYGGELGTLQSTVEKILQRNSDATFGDTVGDVKVTFDQYALSDYTNLNEFIIYNPHVSPASMDVWWAQSANDALHANSQANGFLLDVRIADSTVASWGWDAMQHPYRALEVQPNVDVNLEGDPGNYDPKSTWNSDWAVNKVVGLPDDSTLTVEKASQNSDTDASTPIPADGTLDGANSGSGAELHIFESTEANETGPHAEADSKTIYIVDGVTDNVDGTLTISLDTSNGASISDTGPGGYDANTRIAVTW